MDKQNKSAEEITRYDIYMENGGMEKDVHPKGNWVRFQDHEKQLTALQQANAELVEGLKDAIITLNDWTVSYGAEYYDEKTVEETNERISQVGTLAYIAKAISRLDLLIQSHESNKQP